MKILAIETSCDETAAAVVEGSDAAKPVRVLSNVVASSLPLHRLTSGVVPEVAAREQLSSMIPVIEQAVHEAGVTSADIDAIGVTRGPGLIGSLLVGVETAKALALSWQKPLLPINHLLAHVLVNWVRDEGVPTFPALGIVVSGGHTDLVMFSSATAYTWIGGTRDDAAGECFDKSARAILNVTYPGGPAIAQAAAKVVDPPKKPFLPRPMMHTKSLEMSFSGLKTAVMNALRLPHFATAEGKNELAWEVQEAIVDVLVGKISLAVSLHHPTALLVGGGVVANQLFRKRLTDLSKKLDVSLFYPPLTYCSDNAVMIGAAAILSGQPIPAVDVHADPSLSFIL